MPNDTDTQQPPVDTPPPPLAGNRFFAWMRSLGLTREQGWVGGVCAGIAARLGIDPVIVRGVFVVVAVLGGPAFLLYAAGWLLLPDAKDRIHLEEVFRGRLESPIAGIGALVLLSMLPVTQGFWFAGNAFWGEPYWGDAAGRGLWTIIVLGAIVWFVVWVARRSGSAPAPRAPEKADLSADRPAAASNPPVYSAAPGERPQAPSATATTEEFAAWRVSQAAWKAENDAFRRQQKEEQNAASAAAHEQYRLERAARREVERARWARTRSNPLFSFVVIGLSLIAGGITVLALDSRPEAFVAGLGVTLGVLAVGIIVNGARGHRPGGAQGLALIVLAALVVAAIVPRSPNISYVDDVRFSPTADGPGFYVNGVGDTVLDLREYFDSPAETGQTDTWYQNISLVSGIGDVTVLVPSDAYLNYSLRVGDGSVDGPDLRGSGVGIERYDELNRPDFDDQGLVVEGTEQPVRSLYLDITMGTGDLEMQTVAASNNTLGASE
jgi:phage shock protein PspC (stress-responsive transcriptional regulator)